MRPQAAGYYGGDGLRREGVEWLSGVRKPDPSRFQAGSARPPCQLPGTGEKLLRDGQRSQSWASVSARSPALQDRAVALGSLGEAAAPASVSCGGHRAPRAGSPPPVSTCLGAIDTPPRAAGAPPATPTNPPGVKGQRGRRTRASVKNSGPRKVTCRGTGIRRAAKCGGFLA